MPQLLPLFYINTITVLFVSLIIILTILNYTILPMLTYKAFTRLISVTK